MDETGYFDDECMKKRGTWIYTCGYIYICTCIFACDAFQN